VVFGGFSAKSVQERIVDAGAVAIITADGQYRGKEIALKPACDEALGMGGCDSIRSVIVYKRTGTNIAMKDGRRVVARRGAQPADGLRTHAGERRASLFILYTSGSTASRRACSIRPADISSTRSSP
jgi:acetyl-CoA synthetase